MLGLKTKRGGDTIQGGEEEEEEEEREQKVKDVNDDDDDDEVEEEDEVGEEDEDEEDVDDEDGGLLSEPSQNYCVNEESEPVPAIVISSVDEISFNYENHSECKHLTLIHKDNYLIKCCIEFN